MDKQIWDLGPLPDSPRSHELQQLSVNRFKYIMPTDRFLIRDVRESDYGVDMQIEAKFHNQPTNFIAHVQLKSTDEMELNTDNSFSLRIAPSNLNYVLNGSLGLYVLYIAPRDEFRYTWAEMEYKKIEYSTPDWRKQKSITIRLINILTADGIDKIHNHIVNQSHFHRTLIERFAHGASESKANNRIFIDVEKRTCHDSAEAFEILISSGLDFVAKGNADKAIELAHSVGKQYENNSHIQLILAYATYCKGHFMQCEAHIANCTLSKEELNEHEQYLFQTLELACDVHMGGSSTKEFSQRERELVRKIANPKLRLQAELYALRAEAIELFTDQKLETRVSLETRCLELTRLAEQLSDPEVLILAGLTILEIEGNRLLYDFVCQVTEVEAAINFGFSEPHLRAQYEVNLRNGFKLIRDKMDELLRLSKKYDSHLLTADALLTGGKLLFGFVFHGRFLSTGLAQQICIDEGAIRSLISDLNDAKQIFKSNDMRHDLVKTHMLISDLQYFTGLIEDAKETARAVLSLARTMKYKPMEAHLLDIINGNTALEEIDKRRQLFDKITATQDEDYIFDLFGGLDNVDMRSFAHFIIKSGRRSETDLNSVVKEIELQRHIARIHFDWCRHLTLISDGGHLWGCRCHPTRQETLFGTYDANAAILSFRHTYCQSCTSRVIKPRLDK